MKRIFIILTCICLFPLALMAESNEKKELAVLLVKLEKQARAVIGQKLKMATGKNRDFMIKSQIFQRQLQDLFLLM